MTQWPKTNDVLGTINRGTPAESGLCTLCRADCQGKCETWLTSLRGRKVLYPRDFGAVTAGSANTSHVGVSYNSLRIEGYNYGVKGLPKGLSTSADDCIFPNVSVETSFGNEIKTKCRVMMGSGLTYLHILGMCNMIYIKKYPDRVSGFLPGSFFVFFKR